MQKSIYSKYGSISALYNDVQRAYGLSIQEFRKIGFQGKIVHNGPRPKSA